MPVDGTRWFAKDDGDPSPIPGIVDDGKLGTFGMPVIVGDIIEARNGFDAPPPVI